MKNPGDLALRISAALRAQRGPTRQEGEELRFRCFFPEKHVHGDCNPTASWNEWKGVWFCPVCNKGGGMLDAARRLGLEMEQDMSSNTRRRLTSEEAMAKLKEERLLRDVTIKHFGITADAGKQAWQYPVSSSHSSHHRRLKAFDSESEPKYWHTKGCPNILYGLEDVPDGTEAVVYANGEPAVWTGLQAGIPAVCGLRGEGNVPPKARIELERKGVKQVLIWPDADDADLRKAGRTYQSLTGGAFEVKVARPLEGLAENADLDDLYRHLHGNDEAFREAVWSAPRVAQEELESADEAEATDVDEENTGRPSQADRLLSMVESSGMVFFHDQFGEPHCALEGDGRQIVRLRSRTFRRWLARRFWQAEKKVPRSDALAAALQVLEGKAVFDAPCYHLHVRVAESEGGIWYDLGDGRAVRTNSSGWEIVDRSPILFRRLSHQKPQVEPKRGGTLWDVLGFLNVPTEYGLLVLAYIVAALVPGFSHPILVLHGPQGSAKSLFFRILKDLIDPSVIQVLTAPDGLREFVQTASHHLFVPLDNLSTIPAWLSDAMCRACTGDGFSKRELYTDDDDVIYSFRRVQGLNGINLVVTKPDLLDRSILLALQRISDAERREEKELLDGFDACKAQLLGAMFDVLAGALREVGNVSLDSYPRMADFSRWGCAITRALGYQDADFLAAYAANVRRQNQEAIDASPVAQAVVYLMDDKEEWEGTPTELLLELEGIAAEIKINTRAKAWPKDVRWLWRRLAMVLTNLAAEGIVAERGKGDNRLITIRKVGGIDASSKYGENDVGDVHDVGVASEPACRHQNDVHPDENDVGKSGDDVGEKGHSQSYPDITDNKDIIFATLGPRGAAGNDDISGSPEQTGAVPNLWQEEVL